MLLHAQEPDRGFMQLAFEASEKSKVRALLDLLSASKPGLSCAALLQKQLALADPGEAHVTEAAQAADATPVLKLREIQAEIADDDTVVLEYALGDEKSYVWVVDQQRIVAHALPPVDQIRRLVRLYRNALIARQPLPGENSLDEYQKRVRGADLAYQVYARRLSQLLLGPLALGQAKRVLIVPDGPLQYIPLSALPLPEASEDSAVLVSHHEVVTLPSASALSTLRKAARKRTPPTSLAVIFADPVFERDDIRVLKNRRASKKTREDRPSDLNIALRDVQGSQHIIRLEGSRKEARTIKETLGEKDVLVKQDFAATRDFVLQGALDRYRIIHLATHGIINARHPEMSGLILSLINEKGEKQDGYLRLGDIDKLKLSADLVVLSACESALGKDLESEGTIGLPRGFLHAGARTVVASLWKVDDAATAKFMKGFYGRIQRGENPSAALRGAQLEMSQSPQWSAPFYWAAFVLQGDYK